uniref:Uncharacterized protein n=1 Tax=Rhizophagus irregularis (strain DAOM 181602 / DAOM 197198 / MUCL 43194) TaxID=747089 RepID=U9TER0_RHIID
MQKAKPFSIPKIVDIFIAVCPIDKFGKHLLLNRTWYTWCRDELWKRHKEAEQVYGRVVSLHVSTRIDDHVTSSSGIHEFLT